MDCAAPPGGALPQLTTALGWGGAQRREPYPPCQDDAPVPVALVCLLEPPMVDKLVGACQDFDERVPDRGREAGQAEGVYPAMAGKL